MKHAIIYLDSILINIVIGIRKSFLFIKQSPDAQASGDINPINPNPIKQSPIKSYQTKNQAQSNQFNIPQKPNPHHTTPHPQKKSITSFPYPSYTFSSIFQQYKTTLLAFHYPSLPPNQPVRQLPAKDPINYKHLNLAPE